MTWSDFKDPLPKESKSDQAVWTDPLTMDPEQLVKGVLEGKPLASAQLHSMIGTEDFFDNPNYSNHARVFRQHWNRIIREKKEKKKKDIHLKRAVKAGNLNAQPMVVIFGRNIMDFSEETQKTLTELAKQGIITAKQFLPYVIAKSFNTANWYLDDKDNRDWNAVFALGQDLARMNMAEGYFILGECYRAGLGVLADQNKAVSCYRQALEKSSGYRDFFYEACNGHRTEINDAIFRLFYTWERNKFVVKKNLEPNLIFQMVLGLSSTNGPLPPLLMELFRDLSTNKDHKIKFNELVDQETPERFAKFLEFLSKVQEEPDLANTLRENRKQFLAERQQNIAEVTNVAIPHPGLTQLVLSFFAKENPINNPEPDETDEPDQSIASKKDSKK